jgi:Flp pilus assembly protein TadD
LSISPGDRLGPYELLGLLGAGGMGDVYRAKDVRLDRAVAVKVLPADFAADPERLRRFEQEARAEGVLNHPNVLTVHDIGTKDGVPFLVTELLEGETLRDRLGRGPLHIREAVNFALQIARGLNAAHEKGIVHRDLKPANVFLTRGGPLKILDFGLAKLLGPQPERLLETRGGSLSVQHLGPAKMLGPQPEGLLQMTTQLGVPEDPGVPPAQGYTAVGLILGTAPYMAPEQARGERIDFRTDIFSLGVVLYEMLTGSNPFARPSFVETLDAVSGVEPPALPLKAGKLVPELNRILHRALAKAPADRYPSTQQLVADLEKLHEHFERLRAIPRTAVAAAMVAVLVLVAGTWWFAGSRRAALAREPVSVLIGDLANTTGEPLFEGALEQALQIGLEGAPFITSFNRNQARKLASAQNPNGKGRLDDATARLVSTSQGIKLVVGGSVERHGDGYLLQVNASDPVSNKKVASASAEAGSKAEVLKAVDTVTTKLRRQLGEVKPSPAFPVAAETFTTQSLEAMQAYAAAQDAQFQGNQELSIQEFRKAIAADPQCGRAYSGLALTLANRGERDEAETFFREALARLDRMTERERYRTRGAYYLLTRDSRKAVEEYSRLVEQFPADSAGHMNLALAYFWSRDMQKALAQGTRAAEIYPKQVTAHSNLALYAMYGSDFDLAQKEAETAREMNPSYVKPHVALALSLLATGRPDEAVSAYRRLEGVSPLGASFASMGLADEAAYEGRLADAAAILQRGIAADRAGKLAGPGAAKTIALAEIRLDQGQPKAALAAANEAVKGHRDDSILVPGARIYLATGQQAKALEIADELGKRLEPDPRAYALVIRAEAALIKSDAQNAVRLLREAAGIADTWLGRLLLARAYIAAGAFAEAHSELEQCSKRRGEATAIFLDDVPSYRYFPPVYFYLGRVQDGLGMQSAAESYKTFLGIKAKADPGAPLADEARRSLGVGRAGARISADGARPPQT